MLRRKSLPPPSWARPQLGSCASSGHRRLAWAIRHSWGERGEHWVPRHCLGARAAASLVADSTAFDPHRRRRSDRSSRPNSRSR